MNCVNPFYGLFNSKNSMLWNLKSLLGTSLQFLLQLLPQLLNFFARTLRSKTMKKLQKWSLSDGTLQLEFPDYSAKIYLTQDFYFHAIRGSLSLSDWISAILRFISVYKKMLS